MDLDSSLMTNDIGQRGKQFKLIIKLFFVNHPQILAWSLMFKIVGIIFPNN